MAPTNRQRKGKLVKVHDEIKPKPKPSVKRSSSAHSHIAYLILLVTLAGTISIGHRKFLSTLFENDRHFSHLSALERELAFRTEMGFYFSYFKTIISADSFISGLYKIMKDNNTEYPSTINTLKRFNLYPEVIIGATYRIFQASTDSLNIRTKTCWTVNRGEGLSPVLSCEGLGEPAYFYVESAFFINGLMMGLFFLFGAYLSESLFGGLITVACFMFNHGEATRVMWTPPLRESFGYPLFVLQMFMVTYVIREKKESSKYSILIACSQICFMLSWQFAQFALLTQTIAAFALYMLQYISNSICKVILLGQTIGLFVSFVLLFGNEMLLTSFFASSLLAAWIVTVLWKYYQRLGYSLLILLSEGITFILLTIISKLLLAQLFQLEDDAHIGEILKSKFTTFQNFHTMLYTCAKEFDFIEYETIWKLLMTLLIPSGLVAFIAVLIHLVKVEVNGNKITTKDLDNNLKSTNLKARDGSKPGAEYLYHTLQLIAFTLMALLIMRLKLFWTPHLCLYSSLLASRQIFPLGKKETHMMVLAALFACMAFTGVTNLQVQLGRLGEFSNLPQEELVEWIKAKTSENAVFAGAMPTMATVKLTTLRPIVNHPHYEDIGLRERTKLVYSIYSRKPLQEVKANLDKLGVNFIILEDPWCSQRSKPGCSLPEIWDIEDFENRGKQAACNKIKKNPEPFFKPVFKNQGYHVYQLVRS